MSRLAALLDAPARAGGVNREVKATYHLAISAAPTDRLLTDAEWADIAELYVDRFGLAKRGDDDAVRWVAVRHADNHVHVVATLVRQDGRRVFPHHDFYRAREASLEVERKYRLTPTSPVDRTADPETTRADQRKHRIAVRESVRAGSAGWDDFAGRLRLSGVLVRQRYSTCNPGELTGYAVGLLANGVRGSTGQQVVWFGGGKLAPDLSLPQLRARWDQDGGSSRGDRRGASRSAGYPPDPTGDPSEPERRRLWVGAETAVHRADADVRHATSHPFDASAQATAQAAAASAGEVLTAVSWLVERKRGGPLHTAAEDRGRATRRAPPNGAGDRA